MPSTNPRSFVTAALALSIGLLVAACGGVGGDGGGDVGGQGKDPAYDLYVDAQIGSDTIGDGSEQLPFASITKALSIVQPGQRIKAATGIYDVANGEQFPLAIPPAVELIGDPDARGDGPTPTVIHGHGQVAGFDNMEAAVVPLSESAIVGFTITNDHESLDPFIYDIGIFVNSAAVQIVRNTIQFNVDNGVRIYAGAEDGVFSGNVLADNGTALMFRHGGARTRVEYNKVVDNQTGVVLMTADAGDFGGGVAGSEGNNIFSGNTGSDVMLFQGGGAFYFAENNYWDHVPPTTHMGINPPPPAGVDIWYASGDAIKTDGAKLYIELVAIPVPDWPFQPIQP